MKNAIIYCRVSTSEQVEGTSLDFQEKLCREHAIKLGFNVLKVFVEEGESAKTADRTQLKAMMEYSVKNYKEKEIKLLVIYKIDRLARMTEDYLAIKGYFNRLGIKIDSTTENIEDSPTGRLVENMIANIAQFDNEVRAERCRNGLVEAFRAGRYALKAP